MRDNLAQWDKIRDSRSHEGVAGIIILVTFDKDFCVPFGFCGLFSRIRMRIEWVSKVLREVFPVRGVPTFCRHEGRPARGMFGIGRECDKRQGPRLP